MDVVGSEIGQKMRSAIKAKLTELGCYVDDELPDYVMVMVANKRTRSQMEDDLQLFLADNTELFVNWLHQVLKKLQEVTVAAPLKSAELDKSKEKIKEKKTKEKKDKGKIKKLDSLKKAKKKDKEKSSRKKDEKKAHKSKKKSKHHDMIRPNVPPLLMNIEKESEPSITDVFAGQILKNHGITIDTPNPKEEKKEDVKPVIIEIKRPILPIIDPETITTQPEPTDTEIQSTSQTEESRKTSVSSASAPREEQIKEITEIEAKIQGLKQKLAEQLDSMSDDEDFLNIRTEAEELMNDFAEDVFQEISSQAPVATPITSKISPPPPLPIPKSPEPPKEPETLPQIELKLPKRPIRERLGAREETKAPEVKEKEVDKRTESPERFTPEREPDFWPKSKSAKSRLGDPPESNKRICVEESSDKTDSAPKRLTSRVSSLESRPRAACASVVRVRPRPRARPRPRGPAPAPASSLLLRAVADAHKSLLNIPPKLDPESHQVKRALVLPMRRCVDQKIVIQVPGKDQRGPAHADSAASDVDSDGDGKSSKLSSNIDKEEYVPAVLSKTITNSDYVPLRRPERTSSRRDDTLVIETINIHNTTVDKDKKTQFIVTMDGFNPNCFLTKKLMTEGLLNEEEGNENLTNTKTVLKTSESVLKTTESVLKTTEPVLKTTEPVLKTVESAPKISKSVLKITENTKETDKKKEEEEVDTISEASDVLKTVGSASKKRLSNSSEDDTHVVIKQEDKVERRNKTIEVESEETTTVINSPPVKKRKASPIVFNVKKSKEIVKKKERERTESASSDNHVIVTTPTDTHKYDAVPPLSQAGRKLVWCRSFPACRYGAACAFLHPRCKFAAACTRRSCPYAHAPAPAPARVDRASAPAPAPVVASHVVPAASFKSITPGALPATCKFYPGCVNPACHFYHPKPCRYGPACANRAECNFYHSDAPGSWMYPV